MSNGVRQSKAEQAEAKKNALELLRQWLPEGSKIALVVKHHSRTGLGRTIEVLMVRKGGIQGISAFVARATGHAFDSERGGVKGQFTPSELAHDLARVLHGREKSGAIDYTIL